MSDSLGLRTYPSEENALGQHTQQLIDDEIKKILQVKIKTLLNH